MANYEGYDPQVYKRLELVEKQLKVKAAEQKKQQAAERKQKLTAFLLQNKTGIIRISSYTLLGILLCAVIAVLVLSKI
jgi:hypothetical protein